ncbi:Tubulin-tyrosine ligase family protein [Tritrichomonas foetus]|uniref:Tubulin-tyrosine ligase family protein n=1 Tax=Tritrichomonas foetus TaxID=1144522 RepID=A0A1J4JKG6_9EUKA|nr:Tubulin-tyrosine ligase family protein [Tritrichomonas foetus]|eukprot:OHS99640.1 Tubulin-tyrosine ligase family protein [Tritrichomonas foetus]
MVISFQSYFWEKFKFENRQQRTFCKKKRYPRMKPKNSELIMKPVTISESYGRVFFETSKIAMNELGIDILEEDDNSILVWYDTIKDQDYFSRLMPWQIINRIPQINVICRKASFVRCIQRINIFYPDLFKFLPRSFILPLQKNQFAKTLARTKKTYIVKPDGGALGSGIVIIPPGTPYTMTSHLAIAQEYIESMLIDGYKFDLRVYVLVIASKVPKIYVYRDGIARFCSSPANENTTYSQLTNTAVNRKNPLANINTCTKTIKSVFGQLKKHKIDTEKLWNDIDEAIGLTVLSSTGIVNFGVNCKMVNSGFPRSFQLLGFDVLIDQNLKPWVLEVNFRPSLEYDTEYEKALKIKMLKDLMSIAVQPYSELESVIRARDKPFTINGFKRYISKNLSVLKTVKKRRKEAVQKSDFVKIFPTKDEKRAAEWNEVLKTSEDLPAEIRSDYQLPRIVEQSRCSLPVRKSEGVLSRLPLLQRNHLYPV